MARIHVPNPAEKDYDERVYHKGHGGLSFVTTGVLVLILILIGTYLAFSKSLPFTSEYELTATFDDATTLRPDSPVRIAGVNVGEVTSIAPAGDHAKVTFTVSDSGQPIRDDAKVTIRPRLFLEGNFFLDLRPGSPSAAELESGDDIPMTSTATAVQLDQVLTTLQQKDRDNLRVLLNGYGGALDDEPTAAEDVDQDPDVQGESAAQSINDAFKYGGRAGRSTSQVSQALLGTKPHDLSRMVRASSLVFRQLASQETALRGLITNFATTSGAFAAEADALQRTLAELAPTLEEARPALAELNETFPPLRQFSNALIPAMEVLPGTIDAGMPWLRQAEPLLGRRELGGLARELEIATPQLAAGTAALRGLLPQMRILGRCFSETLLPTGDQVITADSRFGTGEPNFMEFLYGVSNVAGAAGNFDGNGQFLSAQLLTGDYRVSMDNPGGGFNNEVSYGNTISPPLGTQPVAPSKPPPLRTDVKCHSNDLPNLNGPAAAEGPPRPEVVSP